MARTSACKRVQGDYKSAAKYLYKKWKSEMPTLTCCAKIDRWLLGVRLANLRRIRRGMAWGTSARSPHPEQLARQLGFDRYPLQSPIGQECDC